MDKKKLMLAMAVAVLILLALDWAALHDIVKGLEPNYFGEYSMLVFSVIAFVVIALTLTFYRKKIQQSK